MSFRGESVVVQELGEDSFAGCDLALFAASSEVARTFAPLAVRAGALVIDNSSEFRMRAAVPLVVPEINPEAAFRHSGMRILRKSHPKTALCGGLLRFEFQWVAEIA